MLYREQIEWIGALPCQSLGPLAAQEPPPRPDPTAAPYIALVVSPHLPAPSLPWTMADCEFSQFIWEKARPKINALGLMCSRNEWGCNSAEASFEGGKEDGQAVGWGWRKLRNLGTNQRMG